MHGLDSLALKANSDTLVLFYNLSLYESGFLPIPALLQFNDLQECYLQKRRQLANQPNKQEERETNVIHREGYTAGLTEFQSVLSTFTRYRYVLQTSLHGIFSHALIFFSFLLTILKSI